MLVTLVYIVTASETLGWAVSLIKVNLEMGAQDNS